MVSRKVDNPRWLAPEIMENKPYDEKSGEISELSIFFFTAKILLSKICQNIKSHYNAVDVYSFGIMLWELVERGNPFEEYNIRFMMQLEEKIRKGARPTLRENVRESVYGKLMDDCVHGELFLDRCRWLMTSSGNPAQRPSFDVILERLIKMQSNNDEKPDDPPTPKEVSFYNVVDRRK